MLTILGIGIGYKTIGMALAAGGGYGIWRNVTRVPEVKTARDVFEACGLNNKGKDGRTIPWRVKSVKRRENGVRLILKFPYGRSLKDVTQKADAINTAFGVDVAFTQDRGDLILDVPTSPIPSYISFSDRLLQLTRGGWKTVIGMGPMDWVLHDFDDTPHLLVGGLTRGGKTVFLKTLITCLRLSHKDNEIEWIGVDMKPKSLEFSQFTGLWSALVSTPKELLDVLGELEKDMATRASILKKAGCTNVQEYQQVTGEVFKRRFLVIDEYGKAFGTDFDKEINNELMQVTALGAGLGVHVILCTQRPDAQIVTGKIKANLGATICFRVRDEVQSRVILGHQGAEQLPHIRGRAIYQDDDEYTVQVPIVSKRRFERLMPGNVPMRVKDYTKLKKDDSHQEESERQHPVAVLTSKVLH